MSLSRALVAGLGTVGAGALWDLLGSGPLWSIGAWSLRGFHVLCLIAVGLSLAALWALRHLPETTRPPVIDVARAMRREVHQMSSIAGIRGLIHAVSYSVEFMASPFAAREQRRRPPKPLTPAAQLPPPNH